MPVGGGGAWPGFEIDHSEPSGSRMAISRAGRRTRAHKAARPGPAGPAAPSTRATLAQYVVVAPACLPTQPTHKRGRDRFPGHGLVDE